MTDFVDEPYKYILENCSIRDYKGYHQHREVLCTLRLTKKISFQIQTSWLFLVTDTCNEEGYRKDTGLVIKSDGSLEEVSINGKNRINIAGKKYANWISHF